MPVPTRAKSIGSFRANEAPLAAIDGLDHAEQENQGSPAVKMSSSSHIANLRSLSRGRLMPSSERRGTAGEMKTPNFGFGQTRTEARQSSLLSHESVDLLTPRIACSKPSERRRTLAVPPRREETSIGTESVLKIREYGFAGDAMQGSLETPLPCSDQSFSPQVLGVYNGAGETKAAGRRPLKPRNSIDNAEASGYRAKTNLVTIRKRPLSEYLETVGENERQGQGSRIMVYVRLRPMSSKERDAGARCCVRAVNRRDIYLTEVALESDYLRLKRLKGRYFAFDAAFPEDAGQEEIYRTSAAGLVESVLQGRNCSVFCYGATGAGKTHTMLGTVQNPGVMVLALKDLFSKLRQRSKDGDHLVRLSYLEVYNETVKDLLSPGRPLVLREDAKQGIVAAGLTQYQAFSADEVMALLQQGNQNRTTEPTRLNETSSRSHAILQVVAEYKAQKDSSFVTRMGKLSLIDLAGSERALATDQRTLRSLEGANINRSLLALSSCINALVEGKKHIPFRNSKLTQLLKDSLGGACQTAMIANISPSNLSFGETQNTLHWADRAKEIRTKVCMANEEFQVPGSESEQAKLLLEVQKENQQLRMQLAQLQQKLLTVQNNALAISSAVQDPAMVCPSAPPLIQPTYRSQKENNPIAGTATAMRRMSSQGTAKETGEAASCRIPLQVATRPLPLLPPPPTSLIPDSELQIRTGRISMRTPLPCRSPLQGFHSTSKDLSSCRKRSFWDITNSNSPSTGSGRNIRHNNADTPSMLLQPGFLRGRRPSLN